MVIGHYWNKISSAFTKSAFIYPHLTRRSAVLCIHITEASIRWVHGSVLVHCRWEVEASKGNPTDGFFMVEHKGHWSENNRIENQCYKSNIGNLKLYWSTSLTSSHGMPYKLAILTNGLIVRKKDDRNKKISHLILEMSMRKAFIWLSGLHLIDKKIIDG